MGFGLAVGVGDQGEDLAAAGVVALAKGGQALAPGGAYQQLQAQAPFQAAQVIAGHGRRDALRLGRRGQAAALHHGDEHLHAVEQIHSTLLLRNPRTGRAFISFGWWVRLVAWVRWRSVGLRCAQPNAWKRLRRFPPYDPEVENR